MEEKLFLNNTHIASTIWMLADCCWLSNVLPKHDLTNKTSYWISLFVISEKTNLHYVEFQSVFDLIIKMKVEKTCLSWLYQKRQASTSLRLWITSVVEVSDVRV